MTQLAWDTVGQRFYETGVDRGVLYIPNAQGAYATGVAWNGLTTVTESPSGAEATPQYADNIKYLNLVSAEDLAATLEAFTTPPEFDQFDGGVSPTPGVKLTAQNRKSFGLSYRTKVGNDLVGQDFAYKLHLMYGILASPSEKAYGTVNDTPEAINFSYALTTSAVDVPGYKPTALVVIDSRTFPAASLAALETILYGSAGVDPRLPLPAEVIALGGTVTTVTTQAPTYNSSTHVVTIPSVTGVVYQIDGKTVTGTVTITQSKVVTAVPAPGYVFSATSDDDWAITY